MKHTYSSGKSSYSKAAATIYGRGMSLSFCKKFTYWKKRGNQTLTITWWLKNEKKIILTHIRFEYILETSKLKLAMSKQTSIFQFKGFKRTIVHQGQVLDFSNQPPQKRKLLKCPHCDETFKNTQGLSIHVKCKHLNECVKEINTNRSSIIKFKQVEK